MGCHQSKQHHALMIEAKPESGREDNELSASALRFQYAGEPTPHDIRQLRDELFSKDSTMVIASATTSETANSSDSADPLQFGADNVRFVNSSNAPKGRKARNYHYPAALYEEMKSVKHFVPSSNAANIAAQRTQSLQSLPLGDDSERLSVISGLSQLDISDRSLQGFPQFEALVDTMALSHEPNAGLHPFVANLVDTLTNLEEEGEEDFLDCDGNETAAVEEKRAMCALSRYRDGAARRKRYARHSAPPMLEQKMSSEMLADIKALALLAEVQDKSSTLFVTSKRSVLPATKTCVVSCAGTQAVVKYHRSTSEVTSEMTVCSELTRDWM